MEAPVRFLRSGLLISLTLLATLSYARQASQTATQQASDPQAVAAIQQAVKVMGGNAPADSVATGTVIVVAGSSTDQGTIRILTRGTNQTLEEVQTPMETRSVVFSNGEASETVANSASPFPMQRAGTSQCLYFPLPYLNALLSNPDEGFTYLGIESLGDATALHVQATDTYTSNAKSQFLAPFTTTDLWFDSHSGLPIQMAYVRRDTGQSPKIRMEAQFFNYKNISGFLFPTAIQVLINGTPWMTISFQAVNFNSGLTDANFPVSEYRR
jgi:hypothetical protein